MVSNISAIFASVAEWEFGNASSVWTKLLWVACFIGFSCMISAVSGSHAKGRWGFTRMRWFPLSALLFSVLMLVRFGGVSEKAVLGMVLFLIFQYASAGDIRTHEVDDFIHVMVLISGLAFTTPASFPMKLLGAVVLFVPSFLTVFIGASAFGGADIKFMGAIGFALGPWCGVFGTIIAGLAALVVDVFSGAKKKTETGEKVKSGPIPLIPYLSAGFLVTYLLMF